MNKALENLRSKNHRNYTSAKIYATHYYIKFTPKYEREYDILKSDSLLVLYEHPLDVEEWIIPQTLALNSNLERPPIMWCAVKVDHKLPEGCPYEVLEHLYIPDEDKITEKGKRSSQSLAFAEELVDEALRISGNLKENPSDDLAYRRSKWRPAGKVRVWDDRARSYVPVVDVEVRARRWFTTHKGTTNTQGNYLCDGRFRRPANYSIRWEKYHFSVRSGTFEQAKHNGPKQRGNWNPDYGRKGSWGVSDRQQYYALIFQAARDYYYGNRFGLASPPRNSFWRPQTKIAADITARQNRKPSHAAIYARTGGIFPTIYIRTWNDNADRVYAVTAHELAHYSHWDLDREAFRNLAWDAYINGNDGDNAVFESWANGVEWQFTQQRYRNLFGIAGYQYEDNFLIGGVRNGNYQAQTINGDPIYTSIAVDMIDNENQRFTTGGGRVDIPIDRVNGYTIQQIEQGLIGARSWNQWRDNMRNRHVNATENRLNELFANWH